jgi:uncharacterized protein GlcG (DUF336 family)
MKKIILPLLALTGLMAAAQAQIPLASAPITAAPLLPPEKTIPFDQAVEAARAAVAECEARKSPAIVQVMDLNLNPKVLLVGEGARAGSFEPARRKAYTVIKKGMASSAFARSVGSPPVNTVLEGDPNLRPSGGGLPILKGGVIIGAIGVSSPLGGEIDEICAQAGIAKFRL